MIHKQLGFEETEKADGREREESDASEGRYCEIW
jgi:hypothetical protein